jgi:hypothetical protein
MTSPLPPGGPALIPFVIVAGFMVGANLYFYLRLFPRGPQGPTLASVILVLGLLGMTAGLWFALIYAFVSPGDASIVSVFIAGNSMMAVFGAWAISLFFRSEDRRLLSPSRWSLAVAVLLVGNELLMGIAFTLAPLAPYPLALAGAAGIVTLVGAAANSVWFFWPMFANMVLVVCWLPLSRPERAVLLGFAATALVGPWVVATPLAGAAAMSAVMAIVVALAVREVRISRKVSVGFIRTLVGIGAASATMAFAEFFFLETTSRVWGVLTFGLAGVLVMAGEVYFLSRRAFSAALLPAPGPDPRTPTVESMAPALRAEH